MEEQQLDGGFPLRREVKRKPDCNANGKGGETDDQRTGCANKGDESAKKGGSRRCTRELERG